MDLEKETVLDSGNEKSKEKNSTMINETNSSAFTTFSSRSTKWLRKIKKMSYYLIWILIIILTISSIFFPSKTNLNSTTDENIQETNEGDDTLQKINQLLRLQAHFQPLQDTTAYTEFIENPSILNFDNEGEKRNAYTTTT